VNFGLTGNDISLIFREFAARPRHTGTANLSMKLLSGRIDIFDMKEMRCANENGNATTSNAATSNAQSHGGRCGAGYAPERRGSGSGGTGFDGIPGQ
jgi:hypothetical protein